MLYELAGDAFEMDGAAGRQLRKALLDLLGHR
jgi:hypothetical protein